jgi:hypothetical protein
MMVDGYTAHRVRREENNELLRQAARWRLRRDAGLTWGTEIKRTSCRLLCQLGRALVALGEQLEQNGQPRLAAQQ